MDRKKGPALHVHCKSSPYFIAVSLAFTFKSNFSRKGKVIVDSTQRRVERKISHKNRHFSISMNIDF